MPDLQRQRQMTDRYQPLIAAQAAALAADNKSSVFATTSLFHHNRNLRALAASSRTEDGEAFARLRYAQSPEVELKQNDLRPDPHFYAQRKSHAVPPPKPTVTAAPSAKGPAPSVGSMTGSFAKAAKTLVLGRPEPLPPSPSWCLGNKHPWEYGV